MINVFSVTDALGVWSPDSPSSPGAQFIETLHQMWRDDNEIDWVDAEDIYPYTIDRLRIYTDLGLFQIGLGDFEVVTSNPIELINMGIAEAARQAFEFFRREAFEDA